MNHKVLSFFGLLLVAGTGCCYGQGPFCGAAGTPGSNAIHYDSSAIAGWATTCSVVRGPVDIVAPDGPRVKYGEEAYGTGAASSVTTTAVSLGDGGTATLTFDQPIRNIEGPDFAVFENSFNDAFLELAFVEVSTDGERFVRFPATSLTPTDQQVGSNGSIDPTMINNLAGKFRVGYGTPFDLEELRDSAGIDIDRIVYVRLVDVVGTIDPLYATFDAEGRIVNDPYPTRDTIWGSGGFDLTGVAVLQSTVGIDAAEGHTSVRLWPNPVSDRLTVEGARGCQAQLCDLAGRRLGAWTLASDRQQIPVDHLSAGVYVLRIDGMAFRVVKR